MLESRTHVGSAWLRVGGMLESRTHVGSARLRVGDKLELRTHGGVEMVFQGGVAGGVPPHKGGPERPDRPERP